MEQEQREFRQSFKVPKAIRFSLIFLRQIWPKLGFRLALYLFYRPIGFPNPKRELPFRQNALKYRLFAEGKPFAVFRLGPKHPKGHILFIHGWSGRASQAYALAPHFAKADYALYAIEAPGHGQYAGGTSTLFDFISALRQTEQRFGPFVMSIGHSLGGVAIANALHEGLSLGKLVLIGTPAQIDHVIDDFCVRTAAGPHIADRIKRYLQKRYGESLEHRSTPYLLSRNNPPGLLIHDRGDADVDYGHAQENADHWSAARVIATRGLGHRKILSAPALISEIMKELN